MLETDPSPGEEETENVSDSEDETAAADLPKKHPDFYDPQLDDEDERWVDTHRQGRQSDAVLSCPGCLSTICLECQAHAQYEHQFRALDVITSR